MTERAADDAAAIQAGLARLRAERDAIFRCLCPRDLVDAASGQIVKGDDPCCPVCHPTAAAPVVFLVDLFDPHFDCGAHGLRIEGLEGSH